MHLNLGCIHGQDLIRALDSQASQQIGVDAVRRVPAARSGLAIQYRDARDAGPSVGFPGRYTCISGRLLLDFVERCGARLLKFSDGRHCSLI